MSPSRPLGRCAVLVLVASLGLAGCIAAPLPSSVPAVPSSSPSPSPSVSPSPSASAGSPLASPSATPVPSPSLRPTDVPRPPTPDPTPIPSEIAGCGTGQAAFFALPKPKTLAFGHATIEFTTASIGMRDQSYWGSDSIPGGIGLSPDEIRVRVSPGEHVILRGEGMTITDVGVRTYPWKSVSFDGGLGWSNAEPTPLAWRRRADGSVSVTSPSASGDVMVDFHVLWQTTCLEGDGVAYSRLFVE